MKKLLLMTALAATLGTVVAKQSTLNTFCTDYRHELTESCEQLGAGQEVCSDDMNIVGYVQAMGDPSAVCDIAGSEGVDEDQCIASFNQFVSECM